MMGVEGSSEEYPSGTLGAAMGALRKDRVGTTTFTRDGNEPDVLVIGYDTEESLRAQGILNPPEANPFPGAQTGYANYRPMD